MKRSPPTPRIPETKISATILEFAEPLLATARSGATREHYQQMLKLAIFVWNAVAFETWCGGRRYLDEAHSVVGTLAPTARHTMDFWIDFLSRRRRSRRFRDDGRVVGNWEVRPHPADTFRLRAEAHDVTAVPVQP